MAKKNNVPAKKPGLPKTKSKTTAVRNSAIPPKVKKAAVAAVPTVEITYELIARRAYEIYASGTGGTQDDNWHRAERELRNGL